MKNLKDICEGIMDRNNRQTVGSATSDDIKEQIKEFLAKNYNGKFSISKNPNADGKYEVSSKSQQVWNKRVLETITHGLFVFKRIEGDFIINLYGTNDLLTSLEGCPQYVGDRFECERCFKLKSLDGCPQYVGSEFSIEGCLELTSLDGCPKEIGGGFNCSHCESLKSLKGSPEKIGRTYRCDGCIAITSFEGITQNIGWKSVHAKRCSNLVSLKGLPKRLDSLDVRWSGKKFTHEEILKVCLIPMGININS